MREEYKVAKSGAFITLTYTEENVPKIFAEGSIKQTLEPKDFTDFMKRLRDHDKRLAGRKNNIRYFACGEYGEKTHRPHYHAIVFNLDRKTIAKLKTGEIWEKGFTVVGDVERKSINYVVDYVQKKYHKLLPGQKPTFTRMSLKPGLGYAYVQRNKDRHLFHENIFQYDKGYEQTPLPDYFLKKIFGDQEWVKEELERYFEENEAVINRHLEIRYPKDPFGGKMAEKEHKNYLRIRKQKKRSI